MNEWSSECKLLRFRIMHCVYSYCLFVWYDTWLCEMDIVVEGAAIHQVLG